MLAPRKYLGNLPTPSIILILNIELEFWIHALSTEEIRLWICFQNILQDLILWSMFFFSIIFVIYLGLKPKEIILKISLVDFLLKNRGYILGGFLKTVVFVL